MERWNNPIRVYPCSSVVCDSDKISALHSKPHHPHDSHRLFGQKGFILRVTFSGEKQLIIQYYHQLLRIPISKNGNIPNREGFILPFILINQTVRLNQRTKEKRP
jgi:hypothetical protein